ncbi:MAG: GNAT family N-acetyltransferase [Anaerolineales bacterium]|nr:GNAT family N-acetyltransferase [Anaerolineales bacterium]
MTEKHILRDLGDGLILRRATPDDTEALVSFNAKIHSDFGPDKPDEYVAAWTRDLLTKQHPTVRPADFTVVENTKTGEIVSSMNLISQTWVYAGIPFKVRRPELVATSPDYRNRGLVRAQFKIIHQWSAERGEMVQAITSIPYYYRLLDYEMAMDLEGGRIGYLVHVPILGEGETESYHIRPAGEADIPFIAAAYKVAIRRHLVQCLRDEETWWYEILGHSEKSVDGRLICIIERAREVNSTITPEPVDFFAHPRMLWGELMAATFFELKEGVSWLAVTPSVIRYLKTIGEAYAVQGKGSEPGKTFQAFGLFLGEQHPAYEAIYSCLPRFHKPYTWYLRVLDLVGFLRHIAPVLEKRLADSLAVGHSGELKLSFYKNGGRLVFEQGHLAQVEDWRPAPFGHSGDACFPDLTFLQQLFGYRNLEELSNSFADCGADNDTARTLLNVLFPKQVSEVWPIS